MNRRHFISLSGLAVLAPSAAERCEWGSMCGMCPPLAPLPDPYAVFFDWCAINGFCDVAECEVEDVDMDRLDKAITRYGQE